MLTTQENRMPNLGNLTILTLPESGGLLSMPRSSRCFSIFGVKVATIGGNVKLSFRGCQTGFPQKFDNADDYNNS